ncbi:MAG: low molecular weight phosphotyrosine protein phosphatase [Spirochaetaceae bacterium]|nr:low molecular weight phosphotyrosine protein phosphatase [Spirochaetaceae bacterium]
MNKIKIMFVCMGNICRSPLAHSIFQKLVNNSGLQDKFEIESSGTTGQHVGQLPDQRMSELARKKGFDLNHRARRISPHDFEEYQLILAMDKDNLADILYMGREEKELPEIRLFRDFDPGGYEGSEVPDPYYGGDEGFENVFNIVLRTCKSLFERLKEKNGF